VLDMHLECTRSPKGVLRLQVSIHVFLVYEESQGCPTFTGFTMYIVHEECHNLDWH
jgi:hypothetical protein